LASNDFVGLVGRPEDWGLPDFAVVPDAAAETHHPATPKAASVAEDIARYLGVTAGG
jgi:hypothetical protein